MEQKQKKKYIQIVIISIVIILVSLSTIFNSQISSKIRQWLFKADIKVSNDDLVVHFISVGQGDAIAISCPNGEIMLIDAGPKKSQNKLINYIKDKVITSNNDLEIDYLLLSHPDTDHSGGMCAIFEEFEIKNFFRPNIASFSENVLDFAMVSDLTEYNQVINASEREQNITINVIVGQYEFNMGDVLVEIFAPLRVYSTTNQMSPIVKVSYLGKSFLFTGDIQDESERDMILNLENTLDADVLKVAHHGSSRSTSEEFVRLVTPQYAVISVGTNSYGHPHMSTINTLQNNNIEIYTTQSNSIVFVCGRDFFGVINNKTHSFEFVDWWVIVLVINGVLLFVLVKQIIKMVLDRKKDFNID